MIVGFTGKCGKRSYTYEIKGFNVEDGKVNITTRDGEKKSIPVEFLLFAES
tara:strand:+ start:782 stop:934 length:153 start_codon:yes stop_codon:yes gene_type:complete